MNSKKNNFMKYYKEVLDLNEDDWENFTKKISEPLPKLFRLRSSHYCNKAIVDSLVDKIDKTPVGGLRDVFELAQSYDRDIVNSLNLNGIIQRSEFVSMLPPHFLLFFTEYIDVVIDVCASPGNKTKILMDLLSTKGCHDAILLANDVNTPRASLLASECSRNVSHLNFAVTQHNGMSFPNIETHDITHILCDVPCSCDGTVRKSPNILHRWSLDTAYGLHRLQYQILRRSLQLLSQRRKCLDSSSAYSYCVYSTCSLNPLENECVINKALKEFPSAELVDAHEVARKIFGNAMKFHEGLCAYNHQCSSTFSYDNLVLKRCLRTNMFENNSGGFFIALLRIKAEPCSVLDDLSSHRSTRPVSATSKVSALVKYERYFNTQSDDEKILFLNSKVMNNFLEMNKHLNFHFCGRKALTKVKHRDGTGYTYRPHHEMLLTNEFHGIDSEYLEHQFTIGLKEFKMLVENKKVMKEEMVELCKVEYRGKLLFKVQLDKTFSPEPICVTGHLSGTDVEILLSSNKRNFYKQYFKNK